MSRGPHRGWQRRPGAMPDSSECDRGVESETRPSPILGSTGSLRYGSSRWIRLDNRHVDGAAEGAKRACRNRLDLRMLPTFGMG